MHVAIDVFERVVCSTGGAHTAALAARVVSPRGSLHLVDEHRLDPFLAELERHDATLAVVKPPHQGRAAGITLGSLPTHLLHEAACGVLVARTPRDLATWPRTIVVGVDGSAAAAAAFGAASALAERHGANLRPVVATREPLVDLDAARSLAPGLEERDERVLHVLHVLSEEADLLVVGSRGLRGLRALGSVSERIAHEAVSPVLVVRA
jgi:nucleotide-binding universal stress UspA family protein